MGAEAMFHEMVYELEWFVAQDYAKMRMGLCIRQIIFFDIRWLGAPSGRRGGIANRISIWRLKAPPFGSRQSGGGLTGKGTEMNDPAVIVAAGRTAIGIHCGAVASLRAHDLGAAVIQGLLQRSGIEASDIDEVIMGQVLTTGCGQNPARQASLAAKLSFETPAMTINKVCGSGLEAIQIARQRLQCGEAEVIIAGGQESMSNAPHFLPGSREGRKLGHWKLSDSLILDGLWDAFYDCHMGYTAENIAEQFSIGREEQDLFSVRSQEKTHLAQKEGRFRDEIIPLNVPQRRGEAIIFDRDEYPRPGTTLEGLAGLRSAFKPDGTVTAGNASGINDGAAAVIVTSRQVAQARDWPILAEITAYGTAGVDPKLMGTGPVPAIKKCLEKAGWSVDELDLIELNEAFAAQALYVKQELGLDAAKVNVNGGAIALGHPIGASGARILVTLLHEMHRRDLRRGVASLCIGGGMGVAMAVERD